MILPFGTAAIAEAAAILERGGLVAFPTETVYGLGARADRSEAVKQIYRAKGRPAENPSIVHTATADSAFSLASEVPPEARALAASYWPGPLTLVLPMREGSVAPEVTAGGPTVALRVPNHPAALALLEAVGLPLAAPSANRSNAISPTTAEHVLLSLGDSVPLIVDGGPTGFGIESTIVDMASHPPRLLRRGSIPYAALLREVPDLVDHADVVTEKGERAPAPGTYGRHYAPKCPLILAPSEAIARVVAESVAKGARVGSILFDDTAMESAAIIETLPRDPEAYARGLYAALHRLDARACDLLYVEEPPRDSAWDAVRDRLRRASTA